MKTLYPITQLLLRMALGIGFLLPVLDRFGYFGAPGEADVAWGDWANFTEYTNLLMPYLNLKTASFFAVIATVLEVIFGVLLLIGYKVRYIALGSFGLTLIFALCMMFFLQYRVPFTYAVFVVSFSSLMLATSSKTYWSIDAYLDKQKK